MSDTTSDYDTKSEPEELGRRLREAREAVGLPQDVVARHLGIPRTSVSEIETGRRKVSFLELKRLAGLYRRPLAFFSDDVDADVSTDETTLALFRATAALSEQDREQVLRFAEFLKHAEPAAPTRRASGGD